MGDLAVLDTDLDPNATLSVVDADGNATNPDDVPQWASSDESIATVSPSEDGLSCTVTKTGKTGATSISVSSTRSSDSVVLSGAATLTVNPSEETGISVNLQAGMVTAPPADSGNGGTDTPPADTPPADGTDTPPADTPPTA